jgi:hypothetical protein
MDQSPNLALPYIMPSQAQKHVTHNDAIRILDAVVHLAVLDRDLASPPTSPAEGARYIVAAGASGLWQGQAGKVAAFQDGAWAFLSPLPGWTAWVVDEARLLVRGNATWDPVAVNTPLLGVNATADATNRLAVKSEAVLFTFDDSIAGKPSQQTKFNKQSVAASATILFQTAYSGRAEIGTSGDDRLHVKVSADGTNWYEALVVDIAGATPRVSGSGLFRVGSFAKAALPAPATAGTGAIAYVGDASGGAVLAFCNGTNWLRVTDATVIS